MIFLLLPLFILSKTIDNNRVDFVLNNEFSQRYVKENLFISYPPEVDIQSLPSSIIEIPVITSSIAAIWFSGEVYEIEEMDEDLYYSLIKVKKFFKRYFSHTPWDGELKPKHLVKNTSPKRESRPSMLFTAGLDSTATLFRHFDENPILLSYNKPNYSAVNIANRYQFDFHTIHSNFRQFMDYDRLNHITPDIQDWLWDTSMGLTWTGLAAPFLYAIGSSKLYIGSDSTWKTNISFPDGKPVTRATNPVLDDAISPFGLSVKHDCYDINRIEKVQLVSRFCFSHKSPKPLLAVCYENPNTEVHLNCNQCEKCYRTMLEIMANGEDPREYGFYLSPDQVIKQFTSFLSTHKPRDRFFYNFYHELQEHFHNHFFELPKKWRPFLSWFLNLDFWNMLKERPRPEPDHRFTWDDYRDLHPMDMPYSLK